MEYIEAMNKLMMSIFCGGVLIAAEFFIVKMINKFYVKKYVKSENTCFISHSKRYF